MTFVDACLNRAVIDMFRGHDAEEIGIDKCTNQTRDGEKEQSWRKTVNNESEKRRETAVRRKRERRLDREKSVHS